MLRQDDWQKSKLVTVAWQHGQSYGGHLASCMIMGVLANRVRKGWGTWSDVIDNIPKFAAITEMPTGSPSIWEPQFVRLLHEVEGIFDGTQSPAKDALFWCDTRFIETQFFQNKILGNPDHPRVIEMNTLVGFK